MKSKLKAVFKSKVMMVIISLVSAITMLMVPSLVLAADITDSAQSYTQPRWSCLWQCENAIDYASDISKGIMVYGATQTYFEYDAGVEIQLQRYTTSGTWQNVPTYYWSCNPGSDFAAIVEDNISVASGTYRCSLIHTAYDTNGNPLETNFTKTLEITVR